MTHETFREMLPLYVIGALDGDELYNFERYVAENRDHCNAEIAEYQAISDQIALAAPSAQPPPDLYERIAAAIEGRGRSVEASARTPSAPVPAPAAVAERPERENPGIGALVFRFIPWAATAVFAVMLISANSQIRTRERLLQLMMSSHSEQQSNLAAQTNELKQLRAGNEERQRELETLRTANREVADERDSLRRAAEEMRQQIERQTLQTAGLQKKVDEQAVTLDLVMDPAIRVAPLADPKGETKATAKVYWHDARKTGLMVFSNLVPVPQDQGKCLELWAICGNQPPVAAGIGWTDDSGHGVLEVKLAKDIACIDKFAVTVERGGGAPAPEGLVVLIGQ
jgi:anti-sigma-K factor RskA